MLDDSKVVLPFSEMKQNALLGHMLINESFFKMVYKRIKPEWFLSERNAKIYKILLKYYDIYGQQPTNHEFKNFKEFLALDTKEREILYAYISRCIIDTQQIRLDQIKPDLTEWLHTTILLKGMMLAQDAYNAQNIKHCHQILMSAIRDVTATSFDRGEVVTFSDYREYLNSAEQERSHALTTGLRVLDRALLKDSTTGGLQRGDTTLIMAPVNTGKTSCLITMMCHNIRAGHDALLMTHEGRPGDIRLKILANMLNCSIQDIFDLYKTKDGTQLIENTAKLIEKHLRYIPYNKAGMTIEEVVPIIRATQEEWISTHNGKGFDLLVSDYPAILTSELAKKGSLQKRNVDQVIYDNYVQLALEYNFHSLLAIQTNREGSRVNRGQAGENRLLTIEDVQESWGPIAQATNVITLNRGPLAIKKDIITFGIGKCRSAETGVAVVAKSNFGHCMTHSEELGGSSYMGTRTNEEIIEKLLIEFRNTRVPDTVARSLGV